MPGPIKGSKPGSPLDMYSFEAGQNTCSRRASSSSSRPCPLVAAVSTHCTSPPTSSSSTPSAISCWRTLPGCACNPPHLTQAACRPAYQAATVDRICSSQAQIRTMQQLQAACFQVPVHCSCFCLRATSSVTSNPQPLSKLTNDVQTQFAALIQDIAQLCLHHKHNENNHGCMVQFNAEVEVASNWLKLVVNLLLFR